ncbi:MAG: hypothetical protein JWO94_3615 [Verrucomicrobiaceae bacterium]|nr:hypothetical protein [Verrucomicrobiaceae bacterium]
MSSVAAETEPAETPWEEAVFARRAAGRSEVRELSAADEVLRYFASQNSGETERRAWAAALRKPVEAALEDLRHHPRRAASLLAPVVESAVKMARHRRHERRMETLGKWALCLTQPRLWRWALKALWEGEPVWDHIQEKSQWHEVPELVLVDNRTGQLLGRAEALSLRLLSGESTLEEMCSGRRAARPQEEIITSVPDEEGMGGETDSRVLMQVGWRCKLAARVRGQPPKNLRHQLQALCEEAEALLDRPVPQGASQADMIDRLLSGGLVSQVASSRPRGWVIALGAMSLAFLLMWIGVKEYRWRNLVMALDNEPGVKVLEHDTSWGRHEISGLRDPLARSPEELAQNLGISPNEIVMRFKSFVSADEPLVSRRAEVRPHGSGEQDMRRHLETSAVPP